MWRRIGFFGEVKEKKRLKGILITGGDVSNGDYVFFLVPLFFFFFCFSAKPNQLLYPMNRLWNPVWA